MDFELSEEQRAIQDTAREFARAEMMPHAREWDENSTFPVETLRKAKARGFKGVVISCWPSAEDGISDADDAFWAVAEAVVD